MAYRLGALTGIMGLSPEQARTVEEQKKALISLKRRGVPEDISGGIIWLANNNWITGQVITVFGGLWHYLICEKDFNMVVIQGGKFG